MFQLKLSLKLILITLFIWVSFIIFCKVISIGEQKRLCGYFKLSTVALFTQKNSYLAMFSKVINTVHRLIHSFYIKFAHEHLISLNLPKIEILIHQPI